MVVGNHQCNTANINQNKAELGPIQPQLVLLFLDGVYESFRIQTFVKN